MKYKLITPVVISALMLVETSCNKQTYNQPKCMEVQKTVQFVLYTDQDFSGNNSNITFSVFIEKFPNKTLWDSSFVPIKEKDIPNFLNKLVVQKSLPVCDNDLLKVGFRYSIENVGESWHFDSLKVGDTFKILDFNFR